MTSVLAAWRRTVAVAVETTTSALAARRRTVAVAVDMTTAAAEIENQNTVVVAEIPLSAEGANWLVAAVESQTAAVAGTVGAVGKHPQRPSRR